jgi:hypothetical protein
MIVSNIVFSLLAAGIIFVIVRLIEMNLPQESRQ